MPFEDQVTLGLIVVNIILTIILLVIYYRNHRTIKSNMTLGLMFFIFAFLIENLLDFFFYNTLVNQSVFGFTTSHFMINGLELIGLLILLYVTWK